MNEVMETRIENKAAEPNFKKVDKILEKSKETAQATGFMEPGEKLTKKRGPYKKRDQAEKTETQSTASSSAETASSSISSAQIAKPAVQFISGMAQNYVGDPRAGMTPDEMENMAMALGLVMDKYMPLVMNQYGAEAMLIIVMGQYGLRVMALKKVLEIEKMKTKSQTQEPIRAVEPDTHEPQRMAEVVQ